MKILVTGPESSGKSTLARNLAWALDGRYVAEQSRAYLHARGGRYDRSDLTALLKLQLEAESRVGSASFVFCDTGAVNLRIWSEVKYGTVDPEIMAASERLDYELILLLAPDLPYVADSLRETPDLREREQLFDRFKTILPPWKTACIYGPARLEQALLLVQKNAVSG